jgi:hypothetical protein
MKPPKRFALSTLLLAMFAVAAVFGYAQWRRQWLKAEVRELNALNVRVAPSLPSEHIRTLPQLDIRDGFWPVVMARPPIAICFVKRDGGDYVFPGDKEIYGPRELQSRLAELQCRLSAVGLSTVEYRQYSQEGGRTVQSSTSDLNEVGVAMPPSQTSAPRARIAR